MGVNLNEIIDKAIAERLHEPDRRKLLMTRLGDADAALRMADRPLDQLWTDLQGLEAVGRLADWLDVAASMAPGAAAFFTAAAQRVRAGAPVEAHHAAPRTVGDAIELAVRFDREAPWKALQDAVGGRAHVVFFAVGCARQGVDLFLRRVATQPPLAPPCAGARARFERGGDRAAPQTAWEWEQAFARGLGAPTLLDGLRRVGGPACLAAGPLPADDLTPAERDAFGAFVAQTLPGVLDDAPHPVTLVIGLDYPSGGRKPFPIHKLRDVLVRKASTAGFTERRDAQRRLVVPAELAIPDWPMADALLAAEGVSHATREAIRPHYEKWRKKLPFADIVRLLKLELNEAP